VHLNKFIDKVKNIFKPTDKKEWLSNLIDDAEMHMNNNNSLPFKIMELKNIGFSVKVNGLFAFISFYHMPWKYSNVNSWIAIAPYLTNKIFYCKIYAIGREPLKIVINGEVAQFKKVNLVWGGMYKGLVIGILEYGLLIDIGYHFEWHCGSVVGLIHSSQFGNGKKPEDYEAGQEITVIYVKPHENNHHLFNIEYGEKEPQLDVPDKKTTLRMKKTKKNEELMQNFAKRKRGTTSK
jgi:hypothetical protein